RALGKHVHRDGRFVPVDLDTKLAAHRGRLTGNRTRVVPVSAFAHHCGCQVCDERMIAVVMVAGADDHADSHFRDAPVRHERDADTVGKTISDHLGGIERLGRATLRGKFLIPSMSGKRDQATPQRSERGERGEFRSWRHDHAPSAPGLRTMIDRLVGRRYSRAVSRMSSGFTALKPSITPLIRDGSSSYSA